MKTIQKTLTLLGLGASLLLSTGCDAAFVKELLSDPATSGPTLNPDKSDTGSSNNTSSNTSSNSNTSVNTGSSVNTGNSVNSGSNSNTNSGGDGFDPINEGSSGGTTSNNNVSGVFNQFLGAEETYFGPSDSKLPLVSGLTGNDAAGSRSGGPNGEVGILVTLDALGRNAYMQVVNLRLTNRQYLVVDNNGQALSFKADVLGGRPFPSLFVTEIPSLTTFSFEHRTSPNPPRCTYYTATFSGSVDNGEYIARSTGSGSCTHG